MIFMHVALAAATDVVVFLLGALDGGFGDDVVVARGAVDFGFHGRGVDVACAASLGGGGEC